MRKPVKIQGETFPSMTAAAKSFGVSVSAVGHAKRRGRLGYLGNGKVHEKACEISGKVYRSRAAAAQDLGVSENSLYAYLKVKRIIDARIAKEET